MLTDDQIVAYFRDGFLHLPGVIAPDELASLREATERVEADAIAYGRQLDAERGPIQLNDDHGFTEWDEFDDRKLLYGRGPGGERIWRRAEGMWDRDPAYRIVTAHPAILNTVWQLLGEAFVPTHDSMVVKMPGAGAAIPWHRDPTGTRLIAERGDASSDFIIDVYLDRSTRANGALWALPGSHKGGWDDLDPLDFDVPEAVLLETAPGDVLVHCAGVLHGSPTNTSPDKRRTFYIHYCPPAALAGEFWRHHSPEWFAERVPLFERFLAERAAAGLHDTEEFIGSVPATVA